MRVTSFFLLSTLGLAITAQAQDCSKPKAGPNMDLTDRDILLDAFPDGTKVSFVCDFGYQAAGGTGRITCTAGQWSSLTLKCEKRECGSAGEVHNGEVQYPDGLGFDAKAVVRCNDGYISVGGTEVRCGIQGWMGRLPTCEAITCSSPQLVANGDFSPKKEEAYSYSEVVKYTCDKGYTASGPSLLTCSENGNFEPGPPTCIENVDCKEPVINNAEWVAGAPQPPYKHFSTVTYKCKSGYKMKGVGTQTCDVNGQWSPGLPTCEEIPTTPKTTTTTTTPTPTPTGKEPTAPPPGPTNPPDKNDGWKWGVGISVVILVIFIIGCGCYKCGLLQKKTGSQKSYPTNEAPKEGEEVPLS